MVLTIDLSYVYDLFLFIGFFCLDDEPDDDGPLSESSVTCPSSFSENSVDCVSGSKSVGHVSGSNSIGRVSDSNYVDCVS